MTEGSPGEVRHLLGMNLTYCWKCGRGTRDFTCGCFRSCFFSPFVQSKVDQWATLKKRRVVKLLRKDWLQRSVSWTVKVRPTMTGDEGWLTPAFLMPSSKQACLSFQDMRVCLYKLGLGNWESGLLFWGFLISLLCESLNLSEAACYCSSSPPWSVVFINHHQPTFTDREAPSRHYFLYWEKDRKYFVFNYLDMELDCGGGEGGG